MTENASFCEITNPDQKWSIQIEPTHRWIRVKVGGETIVDSKQALLINEAGRLPVYYFPQADIRLNLLRPNDHFTTCIHKGEASYWDIILGDRVIKNAAWGYLNPNSGSEKIKGYISFLWNLVDHWYEEEEEIFVHARDPYTRVDAIPSSRHVQVVLGGQVVADSIRPVIVFETNLTPRYYLPKEDVRTVLLEPSETKTRCPYKGIASYWSVNVGGVKHKDIVWSYQQQLPEIPKIKGLFSFYNEQVDSLTVDGEEWELNRRDRLPYKKIPTDYDND
ncbi:MAG: DUF427 domain-containing protein [Sporolactobacillus sp.]